MKDKIRVSTFAVPLSGNKGSASMLIGLKDAFELSNFSASFDVFSYYPVRDAALAANVPGITVHPGHPKHLAFQILPNILLYKICPKLVPAFLRVHVEAVANSDVVLLIGGTTFADSMLFKVPWNMIAALPGYLLGKKTLVLSQTLGPFNNFLNRICAKWTLKRASAVHGRGRISLSNVQKIGIEKSEYRPDLSFSMKVPSIQEACERYPALDSLVRQIVDSKKVAVGITPNSIVYKKAKSVGRNYIDCLVKVVDEVNQRGFLPVLIPHSYLEGAGTMHNNDRGLCLEVMQLVDGDKGVFLDADLPADILRSFIGTLHLLVASRFHSMISALSMGVPPITFGWGHQKYTEVLSEFGVENLYCSYQYLDEIVFRKIFTKALDCREDYVKRIIEHRPTIIEKASEISSIIASYAD